MLIDCEEDWTLRAQVLPDGTPKVHKVAAKDEAARAVIAGIVRYLEARP